MRKTPFVYWGISRSVFTIKALAINSGCLYAPLLVKIFRVRNTPKKKNKVLKNFKLRPEIAEMLDRESQRQNRTQTMIVEISLKKFFGIL